MAPTRAKMIDGANPMNPSTNDATKSHQNTLSPAPMIQPRIRKIPTIAAKTNQIPSTANMVGENMIEASDANMYESISYPFEMRGALSYD